MLSKRTVKLIFALLAFSVAVVVLSIAPNVAAQQDGLPESAGVEVLRNQCLNCHEADLIVSQRLSKAGWTREVDKMIRWGAVVKDTDKEPLVDYLTRHFGQRPLRAATSQAASSPELTSVERGRAIFENKCLLCHEADLTEQQRLSRTGWTREVEKMVRWGAVVTDAEKEPLVDYLFKNYGPKTKPLSK